VFDPDTPIGREVITGDFPDDAMMEMAIKMLTPEMETLVPPEYRDKIRWFSVDPVPNSIDIMSTRGTIGWKYEPQAQ
jgi:hypothetical protein